MKIIVSDELEKDLVKRLFNAISQCDMVEEIIKIDAECEPCLLNGYDSYFIEDFFNSPKIEVDEKVMPLYTDHHNLTGTCVKCGTQTEGTIDGDDVSYEEFIEYMENCNEWHCESCMSNKEEQVQP